MRASTFPDIQGVTWVSDGIARGESVSYYKWKMFCTQAFWDIV